MTSSLTSPPPPHPLISFLISFLTSFLVYTFTMSHVWALDTLFAIDSSEMVIAAHTLGIDHPPGHPLYLIFAHLFSQLPFHLPDTGVIFTSVFFSALTAGFLALAFYTITNSQSLSLSIALIFAFTRVFWIHAAIAEVYALQLAFLALYLWLAARLLKSEDPRDLYLIAFAMGLSTTANILLTILLMPSFLYVVLRSGILFVEKRWQPYRHLRAKAWSLLGISPLLYIPIRLASDTAFISDFVYLNGFSIQSLRWYIWYLSAEEFTGAKLFELPIAAYPGQIIAYFQIYASNATPLVLLLAILGIGMILPFSRMEQNQTQVYTRRRQRQQKDSRLSRMLVRTSDPQRTWHIGVLIAFLTTLIPVLSYRVPDREVFFMPSFFFLTTLAGMGLWFFSKRMSSPFRLAILVIPIFLLALHLPEITAITKNDTVYEQRLTRFKNLPARSMIIGPDDGHATRYKYFQIVRELRPDITIHTMGMLAPRIQSTNTPSEFSSPDLTLGLNVTDRLRVIQHLQNTYPERPLFAILDDRMPPEYDHFRTERSKIDPFLLRIRPKPQPEISKTPLPVAIHVQDGYFNTFRFIGFSISGLDRGQSRTFEQPLQVGNREIHALIQRSEMFEISYQAQRTQPATDKIFAEFAFVNERLEIPSVQGFTAAKTVELIPDTMAVGTYRKDRFTFKIPAYIPPGLYTLTARATTASNTVEGTYQGKPIRRLAPLKTNIPWRGQTDYRPLGTVQIQ